MRNSSYTEKSWFFGGRFWISALLMFTLLLSMRALQNTREAQASLLAPGVLRLHIRADSNAAPDQEIKLEVRSLILDFLRARRDEMQSKASALRLLQNHRAELTAAINNHLKTRGFAYRAVLSFVRCCFPTRSYGGTVYPCGVYDAARITLGSGRGHNWWCVLYPKLCLAEETWETGNEIAAGQPAAENHEHSSRKSAIREITEYEGSSPEKADCENTGQKITEKRQEPLNSPAVTLKFRLLPDLSIRLPGTDRQQQTTRDPALTRRYPQKNAGISAIHSSSSTKRN